MTEALLTPTLLAPLALIPVLWFLPLRQRVLGHAVLVWLVALGTSALQLQVLLTGATWTSASVHFGWMGDFSWRLDGLSALFGLVVNGVTSLAAAYGVGYLRGASSGLRLSLHGTALNILHAGMVAVLCLDQLPAFLVVWEVMSLASLVLVVYDWDQQDVRQAGIRYAIQMHFCVALLLGGALCLGATTGSPLLSQAGATGGAIVLLLALGFSVKAGLVPLHTWLPSAHPAAPAHVSAIFSAAMIKLGLYGLIRLAMSLPEIAWPAWAWGLCIMGGVSALWAVVQAGVQRDLKRVLAYSSIENMGLMMLALGLFVFGRALHQPVLAALAMAGLLLHLVAHGLMKASLFFGAGSVYHATHTRNLDALGGLLQRMPSTGRWLVVAAVAAAALPPMGTFASEFLLYAGLTDALHHAETPSLGLLIGVLLTLVLVGGVALFAMSRWVGIALLGSPRTEAAAHAHEVSSWMVRPQAIAAMLLLLLGVGAPWVVSKFEPIVGADAAAIAYLKLLPLTVGLLVLGLIVGMLSVLRFVLATRRPAALDDTWGCGYTAGSPVVQYTATTFGDSLVKLMGPLVRERKQPIKIVPTELFPSATTYRTQTSDPVDSTFTKHIGQGLRQVMLRLAVVQTGQLQHYLVYMVGVLVVLWVLTQTIF